LRGKSEILLLRHLEGYRFEGLQECGATKAPAARTNASLSSRRFSRVDLAEFNAGAKDLGQVSYKGAEVNTAFRCEVERHPVPIELIFGIDCLHRQMKDLHTLPASFESLAFFIPQVFEMLDLVICGSAQDLSRRSLRVRHQSAAIPPQDRTHVDPSIGLNNDIEPDLRLKVLRRGAQIDPMTLEPDLKQTFAI
jgi:hypothetical protein